MKNFIKWCFLGIFFTLILFVFFQVSFSEAKSSKKKEQWQYEGVSAYVFPYEAPGTTLVYRFIHCKKKNRFYTSSLEEKDLLVAKYKKIWTLEGSGAFYIFNYQAEGTAPVFRLQNKKNGFYFDTISEVERDNLINSSKGAWISRGVAYYAYTYQAPGTVPLYRFYDLKNKTHFWTSHEEEAKSIGGSSFVPVSNNQSVANPVSPVATSPTNLGPEISVGILSYDKSYSKGNPFEFKANKDYAIKDKNGNLLANIFASEVTKVRYDGGGMLRVYNNQIDKIVSKEIVFEGADGNNVDLILNVEPKQFNDFRGKLVVRFVDSTDKVWVINYLPLEQYVWGMGEITGTGAMEYNKVMTTVYRTYGYWKILYSTRYKDEGFKVDATPGNQVYYGYDWETRYPRIREGAEGTWGQMVFYKGEVAITPYSSSTDGKTRSWEDVWGSKNYQYCKSVDDSYGKQEGAGSIPGNHMVGLSARGALNLASDHGWSYDKILNYYYTGIEIRLVYY